MDTFDPGLRNGTDGTDIGQNDLLEPGNLQDPIEPSANVNRLHNMIFTSLIAFDTAYTQSNSDAAWTALRELENEINRLVFILHEPGAARLMKTTCQLISDLRIKLDHIGVTYRGSSTSQFT